MRKRRHKRYPGAAGKGSHPRLSALPRRTARQGKLSERGRTTTEAVAKRRVRSLKRETGAGRKDVLQARARRRAG